MTKILSVKALLQTHKKNQHASPSHKISRINTLSSQALTIISLIVGCSTTAVAGEALPKMTLQAGSHQITAEVAATPSTREIGLMHRKSLATNHGMLFIFEQKAQHCFWMRNTLIPLSIAFIADDGTIINIENMQPQTEQNHCAQLPVRYALEMNQGWFSKKGIKVGTQLGSIPK